MFKDLIKTMSLSTQVDNNNSLYQVTTSKLFRRLLTLGVVPEKVRKNMKKPVLADVDKALLRKRAIVETVIDQLKNISQIEHTRHRSVGNFCSI